MLHEALAVRGRRFEKDKAVLSQLITEMFLQIGSEGPNATKHIDTIRHVPSLGSGSVPISEGAAHLRHGQGRCRPYQKRCETTRWPRLHLPKRHFQRWIVNGAEGLTNSQVEALHTLMTWSFPQHKIKVFCDFATSKYNSPIFSTAYAGLKACVGDVACLVVFFVLCCFCLCLHCPLERIFTTPPLSSYSPSS